MDTSFMATLQSLETYNGFDYLLMTTDMLTSQFKWHTVFNLGLSMRATKC